jgi:hypothetical protein
MLLGFIEKQLFFDGKSSFCNYKSVNKGEEENGVKQNVLWHEFLVFF